MPLSYKTEYYMICGLPVAAIKTVDDRLVQAWGADKGQGRMVRDARLIDDIETDSRVRPMTKMAFDAHCAQNNIVTAIPERAIQQTLILMSRDNQFPAVNRQDRMSSFGNLAFR